MSGNPPQGLGRPCPRCGYGMGGADIVTVSSLFVTPERHEVHLECARPEEIEAQIRQRDRETRDVDAWLRDARP